MDSGRLASARSWEAWPARSRKKLQLEKLGQGIARMVAAGTTSELTGGKFANGAATAAFSSLLSAIGRKFTSGGEALDSLPEDPRAVFEKAMAAAEGNPYTKAGGAAVNFYDRIAVGRCNGSDACHSATILGYADSAEEAKLLLARHQDSFIVHGDYYKGAIRIFPTATSPTYYWYQDKPMRALASIKGPGTHLTGIEHVIEVLAHEVGHHLGLMHGMDRLYMRERMAVDFYRESQTK